jgi:hypothetical protein
MQMKDVTNEIRRLVLSQGGWQLEVPMEWDLDDVFGKSYNSSEASQHTFLVSAATLRKACPLFRWVQDGRSSL